MVTTQVDFYLQIALERNVLHVARVAQRFSDVYTLWSSYQWANISAEPHVASNVRYIAFSMRTTTLLTHIQARYFHVTPNS